MSEATQPGSPLDRKLSGQQLDIALRQLDSLPTFPGVILRLSRLASQAMRADDAEPFAPGSPAEGKIVRIVSSDVALTARLLSLANRDRPGTVATISRAVSQLGAEAALSGAFAMPLARWGGDAESGPAGPQSPEFRQHCLAVAVAAEMIALRTPAGVDPAEAFACGLLHDVGKLALSTVMPKTYRRVLEALRTHTGNIADHERSIVGVDHCVVGRRLAERWQLPVAMQHLLWLMHQPAEALPASMSQPDRLLVGVVALADTLARRAGLGFSGNFAFARTAEELARPPGLSGEALAEVEAGLAAEVAERCGLADLDSADEQSAGQALAEANAALGRIGEHLGRRRAGLAAQAEAFQHFRRFADGLSPDATVWQLLGRIAEMAAWAGRLDASAAQPVIAYAVGDAQSGVAVVRYDAAAQPDWRTLARARDDEPLRPPAARASAAEALERLLAQPDELTDWVDLSACAHHTLACGELWVGGVLYPAALTGRGAHDDRERVLESLTGPLAAALATAQARARAVSLGEQLAAASQLLAAAQDALADARTLAAVGEMAAGAAHEMNTPLAVISGRAQLMARRAAGSDEQKTWQLIADQAQRVSDIVTDLMDLASPPAPKPEALDAAELLAEAARALACREDAKAREARVDIQVGKDVPPAIADRRQILSVLTDLLDNAVNAAGEETEIRLSAEADEANDAVLLIVQDNGPGMAPETLSGAFTPFFSRQRAGRRRGLGLPRAKRYVQNNGGRIWIHTQPGEGTTVYVQLPHART